MKGKEGKGLLTEYVNCPSRWRLDDERYTWLSEEDKKALSKYPFDFGDILYEVSCFAQKDNIPKALGTNAHALSEYCMLLWNKDWEMVHQILSLAARNSTVSNVFARWAEEGSAAAMSIMARSVMRLDDDAQRNELRIRIVNDLEDDD